MLILSSVNSFDYMNKHLLYLSLPFLLASCGGEEQADAHPDKKKPKVIGEALADGYSRDSTHIYYDGDTMEVAQPATFRVLGGGYAKDGFSAYYKGKEVQGAQGATFRWLAGDTAADVMDTYVRGVQQPIKKQEK